MSAANVTPLRPDHEQRYRRWEPERFEDSKAVSYTHLRAHETVLDLVCRLLLEKKKHEQPTTD